MAPRITAKYQVLVEGPVHHFYAFAFVEIVRNDSVCDKTEGTCYDGVVNHIATINTTTTTTTTTPIIDITNFGVFDCVTRRAVCNSQDACTRRDGRSTNPSICNMNIVIGSQA